MRKWLLSICSATAGAVALTMAPVMPAPQAGAGSGSQIVLAPDTTADSGAPESALTLREAFDDAQTIAADSPSMGTIRLSPGATYELDDCDAGPLRHWDSTGALVLVDGRGATIRQTCWTESVVFLGGAADYWFSDVTITGGTGPNGGGIAFIGSNLFLNRSTISGNHTSGRGGGVYALGDVHLIRSTIFANNANLNGGGIYSGSGVVNIDRSSVVANHSTGAGADNGRGGGIYGHGATTITRSTISWNRARVGGGLYSEGDTSGDTSVVDSTLDHNLAEFSGGAIHHGDGWLSADDAELQIVNSTVSHNAARYGGGIASATQFLDIDSATFEENTAYVDGAHVRAVGGLGATATNSVFGTAIAGAGCTSIIDSALAGSANFDSGNTCGFDPASNIVDGGDPGLGPLTDNGGSTATHLPGLGSAVVGQPLADAACLSKDQRGVSRPRGRHCDIGAVER